MANTLFCKKCGHEMEDTVCKSNICSCVCDTYGAL